MLNVNTKDKKALIFDCDGTLADTMPAHKMAYKFAFELNKVPYLEFELDEYLPLGGQEFTKIMLVDRGYEDKVDAIVRDKQLLLPPCIEKLMRPNKELIEFLKYEENEKYIAVVSNGRRKSIEHILRKLGVINFVDLLVTKEDTERAKPFPDPYLLALKLLNYAPNEVIVFEDNTVGTTAAVWAGITDIVEVDTNGF